MAHLSSEVFRPNAADHDAYGQLYREYVRLHDHFGRGGDDAMKTLRQIQRRAAGARE
jgi:L-ribulokinase